MPSYPGAPNVTVPVQSNLSPLTLNPGDSAFLFGKLLASATQAGPTDTTIDFEGAPTGFANWGAAAAAGLGASIAVTSGRKEAGSAPSFSLQLIFNGNPGAFNFQIQEASTDADGCYLTPTNAAYTITTATQHGGVWIAFVDDIPTGGKFQRAILTSLANDVKMQAKFTLLS